VGLITGLLTLPLAPVRGAVWLAEQVQAQAEREYAERTGIGQRLAEIQQSREAGVISAEESARLEEQALDEFLRDVGEDG
jgi:hypothetical protein